MGFDYFTNYAINLTANTAKIRVWNMQKAIANLKYVC